MDKELSKSDQQRNPTFVEVLEGALLLSSFHGIFRQPSLIKIIPYKNKFPYSVSFLRRPFGANT
jgi:hypothetical protein